MEDSYLLRSAARRISAWILTVGLCAAIPALGQSSIPLNTLTLNGSATLVSGNYIQLTSVGSEAGSAFIPTPYALGPSSSFEVAFIYNAYTPVGGTPADGLAFVAQNTTMGASFLGLGGSGLGFITQTDIPAIGVTFDFYANAYTGTLPNAAAITLPVGEYLVATYPNPPIIAPRGDSHRYVWVEYNNPMKALIVYYSTTSTKPATPILTKILATDLSSEFGGQVYFGFTGGTGASYVQQSITAMAVDVVN